MNRTTFTAAVMLLVLSVLVAACAPAAQAPTEEPAEPAPVETEEPTEEMTEEPTEEATEEATKEPAEEMTEEAEPTIVEAAMADESFSTLVAAVDAAGLADTLNSEGPFTVFAPTNDAFSAAFEALGITAEDLLADTDMLTSILLYHVVPGEVMAADVLEQNLLETAEGSYALAYATDDGAFINNAEIVQTDIAVANGVIHVIDAVILPPAYETESEQSIVDIAAGDEQFSTLVAAVQAAGLADVLANSGPFTVFAPTNAAFDAAFEALGITAEDLLADTELLTDILLYHVTVGALTAEDVTGQEAIPMANGDMATVEVSDGSASIAGAPISVTDLEASNGIIHVIDAVMLPPSE